MRTEENKRESSDFQEICESFHCVSDLKVVSLLDKIRFCTFKMKLLQTVVENKVSDSQKKKKHLVFEKKKK